LWSVVFFKDISLKDPSRGLWCVGVADGRLVPRVFDLPGVDYLLTYGWSSCNELLSTYRSFSVGILALLALFTRFSVLRWCIRRDVQDLTI
jgi:hypothetical protein